MQQAQSDQTLLTACRKAFINGNQEASDEWCADIVMNALERGETVLSALTDELAQCESYSISVAFVTMGGFAMLTDALYELGRKGIKGELLTTDYQWFSEPQALRRLMLVPNLTVRFFRTSPKTGFHTKGYIFRQPDVCRIILGSSNLTQAALKTSQEWNARLISKVSGAFARKVEEEFQKLWHSPATCPVEEVIDAYEHEYFRRSRLKRQLAVMQTWENLTPNSMQTAFVEAIQALFDKGETRALLISATGTGKTFAAAFATKKLVPKKTLFLVHNEQILLQARLSFERVLGKAAKTALYTGNEKDPDVETADLVFSTMQTLSKDAHSARFDKKHFDLIIVDEVHHASADSYRKIMRYFEPRFWLGMTASPDRPDGDNIYEIFHYNIAYEIRLQTALKEDLLCPFHYHGIADVTFRDGTRLADVSDLRLLSIGQQVNFILEKVEAYGWSGTRLKALLFASTVKECEELSQEFNRRGLHTAVLSGENKAEDRADVLAHLGQDEKAGGLDMVLSVGVLSEGVDVVSVNVVIFMRPTESPIVFIQQLGRGLRKAPNKEFVNILDFIGNSDRNWLIPVALSGDNSYSKEGMRKFIQSDSRTLPGASTVQFDEVAREKIYRSIDKAATGSYKLMKESYDMLRRKLGRRPDLVDFDPHNGIDPRLFFEHKDFGSYYAFLKKADPASLEVLSERAEKMIWYLSKKIGNAHRLSEVILLDAILGGETGWLKERFETELAAQTGRTLTTLHLENVLKIMSCDFQRKAEEAEALQDAVFVEKIGDDFRASSGFLQELTDEHFARMVADLTAFVRRRWTEHFAQTYRDTAFVINERYTYEDVCRLLDWDKNLNGGAIGGYFYDYRTKTLPVFINYEKADRAIQYNDRFKSPEELVALSKTDSQVTSVYANHIYKRTDTDRANRLFLFVRRNKKDIGAKAFYFLGEIEAVGEPRAHKMPKHNKPTDTTDVFEIDYRLESPVSPQMYRFLTVEDKEDK